MRLQKIELRKYSGFFNSGFLATYFAIMAAFAVLFVATGCQSLTRKPTTAEGKKLNAVVEDYTERMKRLDAFFAPVFNVEEDFSKFGDYASPDYFKRARAIYESAVKGVQAIDSAKLSSEEQVEYVLFKDDVTLSLKDFDYPGRYLSFNQMYNRLYAYLDETSDTLTSFPFDSVKHYEDFVKRSEGFLTYVDNQIALLKEGTKKNIVHSCAVARQLPNSYREGLEKQIEKHPFWRPIQFMPKTFSSTDRARLESQFRQMIIERIQPGYKKFDTYFRSQYLPKCQKGFGVYSLPQAADWYSHQILRSTGLRLTAEEIHKIGMNEVTRIAGEIEKIKVQLGYRGSYQNFLKSLLNDQKYFYKDAKTMFAAFTRVDNEVKKKIKDYFDLVPKSELRIVETSNPESAAGMYSVPTEIIPYGRFIVNTKNLRSVPVYGVTTLMLHEAVPGHHFQLAIAYEMKDELSYYRRRMYDSVAFVEGWALYAEYLGIEMGLFQDPLQRLGNLNDEMLRAVRLVVDTGIHHYGWSQKRVIDFMAKYLASDINDITREANRYSVLPGQALGYKLGQLHIIELRKWAQAELGSRFDIRGFHRAVLGAGTISLSVLESRVKAWVATVKR